jgi:hypothetical protein
MRFSATQRTETEPAGRCATPLFTPEKRAFFLLTGERFRGIFRASWWFSRRLVFRAKKEDFFS